MAHAKHSRMTHLFAAVLFLCASTLWAQGVIQTPHGSLTTNTVEYQNIVEASTAGVLFGTPFWEGDDTIVFKPTNFAAQATLPDLSMILDGQMRFTVDALPGQIIPQLLFQERGSYDLVGNPNDFAIASVFMPVFFQILEIDNTPVMGPMGMADMVFTPLGGVFSLTQPGPGLNGQWSGSLLLDFDQIIANDPNFAGHATRISITFDNTLSVYNSPGTTAAIRKNLVRISVPEFGSLGLVGGAAGIILAWSALSRWKRSPSINRPVLLSP